MSNGSVAIQIWIIGALAPLAFILTSKVGNYDFAEFWEAAKQALGGQEGAINCTSAKLVVGL